MTKRLTAVALCAAAMLAIGGVATADARGLTRHDAKQLAKRLANKQVRGRGVISFHILLPRRVSASEVVFLYDDRTKQNVYCTATIIVTQSTKGTARGGTRTTTRARFFDQSCNLIPGEVLRFEAATRTALRDVRANRRATTRAVRTVERSAIGCKVRPPRSRTDDAELIFGVAFNRALFQPNGDALLSFVARLTDVGAGRARLAAGAAAWTDLVATVAGMPDVGDPCKALRAWAGTGYAADQAPIDFAATRASIAALDADTKAINGAARLMARFGAFPSAAVGFTADGLLSESVGNLLAGNVGPAGKLSLR
jgi:hypothetical protein